VPNVFTNETVSTGVFNFKKRVIWFKCHRHNLLLATVSATVTATVSAYYSVPSCASASRYTVRLRKKRRELSVGSVIGLR